MNPIRHGTPAGTARWRVRAAAGAIALAGLGPTGSFGAVTPVHKCTENGVVTFQNMPCKPEEAGTRPTAAQLNAERQKKQRQKAASDAAARQQPAAAASAASRPKRSK